MTTPRVRATYRAARRSRSPRDFGLAAPRIGVVGLNPHAGEDGLLGVEDRGVIAPALVAPAGPAILSGPLVPDAAFRDHLHGRYDAVVAMYHDQALIPVKLSISTSRQRHARLADRAHLARSRAPRTTSRGKGVARAISMQRALALAFEMLEARARAGESRLRAERVPLTE